MAPTRANIMPSGTGHIRRPSERVVDIRDDFSTRVFRGVQDPYAVGGPRANSVFHSESPPQHPAITPPPGYHGGSPIARSLSGNTIVPFPHATDSQSSRSLSFAEIVEQFLPAPPMPDFASVHAARADLLDALRKLGHRMDDVAQTGMDCAREAFYDAVSAIEQPFAAWKEHIIDLIVASAAYRAGREDEIATNFEGLNDDWDSGTLSAVRNPIEIGLAKQINNLIDTLATFRDAALPPLLSRERKQWGERDTAARQLASNVRLDIVKTTSHIIEALGSTLIDERTTQLARLVYDQSRSLLAPGNNLYNRRAVSLALHRILTALKGAQHEDARKTVALAYYSLIGIDNSAQNESLILSYGNLVWNASDGMIHSARMILGPSINRLGEIVENGETPKIQAVARKTRNIIANRLEEIGIGLPRGAITMVPHGFTRI
jgi:hypothetical protein